MKVEINHFDRRNYLKTVAKVKKVKTICQEANCPNRYECFAAKTATFLLLGNICTRSCYYCGVKKGVPLKFTVKTAQNEIAEIIKIIADFKLEYVVLTQVTRDDLEDGGANHIVNVIRAIRERFPLVKIEVLISDLNGNDKALAKILAAKPDVLNHNIEIVEKYFSKLRPQGDYNRSLALLNKSQNVVLKSGFMVGFGESEADIMQTLNDLYESGVSVVTIGQYLPPSEESYPLQKLYSKKAFVELGKKAEKIGFEKVVAGVLVRSSYRAKECLNEKMAVA